MVFEFFLDDISGVALVAQIAFANGKDNIRINLVNNVNRQVNGVPNWIPDYFKVEFSPWITFAKRFGGQFFLSWIAMADYQDPVLFRRIRKLHALLFVRREVSGPFEKTFRIRHFGFLNVTFFNF